MDSEKSSDDFQGKSSEPVALKLLDVYEFQSCRFYQNTCFVSVGLGRCEILHF